MLVGANAIIIVEKPSVLDTELIWQLLMVDKGSLAVAFLYGKTAVNLICTPLPELSLLHPTWGISSPLKSLEERFQQLNCDRFIYKSL